MIDLLNLHYIFEKALDNILMVAVIYLTIIIVSGPRNNPSKKKEIFA